MKIYFLKNLWKSVANYKLLIRNILAALFVMCKNAPYLCFYETQS